MEKRYFDMLQRDPEYAPLIELSEIYLGIVEANKDRNGGTLDEEGRFIDGLLLRTNNLINKRVEFLRKLISHVDVTTEEVLI